MKYWISYRTVRPARTKDHCAIEGDEAGTLCIEADSEEAALNIAKADMGPYDEVTGVTTHRR